MMVRKTHLPVAKNARILATRDLKRRLQNARVWNDATEEMCNDWMGAFLTDMLRKQEAAAGKLALSAAKAKQLELFPGFEHLPVRIRAGKGFVKFPELSVGQFLKYEAAYQSRAQQNQQTAEELRRLRIAVKPQAEIDPDMPMARAYDRATTEPAKLTVVSTKGA